MPSDRNYPFASQSAKGRDDAIARPRAPTNRRQVDDRMFYSCHSKTQPAHPQYNSVDQNCVSVISVSLLHPSACRMRPLNKRSEIRRRKTTSAQNASHQPTLGAVGKRLDFTILTGCNSATKRRHLFVFVPVFLPVRLSGQDLSPNLVFACLSTSRPLVCYDHPITSSV